MAKLGLHHIMRDFNIKKNTDIFTSSENSVPNLGKVFQKEKYMVIRLPTNYCNKTKV